MRQVTVVALSVFALARILSGQHLLASETSIAVTVLEKGTWLDVTNEGEAARLSPRGPFRATIKTPPGRTVILALVDANGTVTWLGKRTDTAVISEFDLQVYVSKQNNGKLREGPCFIVGLPHSSLGCEEIVSVFASQVAIDHDRTFGVRGAMGKDDYLALCDELADRLGGAFATLCVEQSGSFLLPVVFHSLLREPPPKLLQVLQAQKTLQELADSVADRPPDREAVHRALSCREEIAGFYNPDLFPEGHERLVRATHNVVAILTASDDLELRAREVRAGCDLAESLLLSRKSPILVIDAAHLVHVRGQINVMRGDVANAIRDFTRAARLYEESLDQVDVYEEPRAAKLINDLELIVARELTRHHGDVMGLDGECKTRIARDLRQTQSQRAMMVCVYAIGRCVHMYRELGVHDRAREWSRWHVSLAGDVARKWPSTRASRALNAAIHLDGVVAADEGDLARARLQFENCLSELERSGVVDHSVKIDCMVELSRVESGLGDLETSASWKRRALEYYHSEFASGVNGDGGVWDAQVLALGRLANEAEMAQLGWIAYQHAAKRLAYGEDTGVEVAFLHAAYWMLESARAFRVAGETALAELRTTDGMAAIRVSGSQSLAARRLEVDLAIEWAKIMAERRDFVKAREALLRIDGFLAGFPHMRSDDVALDLADLRRRIALGLGDALASRDAVIDAYRYSLRSLTQKSRGFSVGLRDLVLSEMSVRDVDVLRLLDQKLLPAGGAFELIAERRRLRIDGLPLVTDDNVSRRVRLATSAFFDRQDRFYLDLAALEIQGAVESQIHKAPSADILAAIGETTCVLEFLRTEQDAGARYGAFVVQRQGGIAWVDLGEAREIDEAIVAWRGALEREEEAEAARQLLAERLWRPLQARFAPGIRRVYLAPDGPLALIPWAALPGQTPSRFLLEDYTLALVPYGAFLADRPRPITDAPTSPWLLVGNVDYDRRPLASDQIIPAGEEPQFQWSPLPYTRVELEQVAALLPEASPVVRLEGDQATTERLLAELGRSRYVHLATHAFYANPRMQVELGIDTDEERQRLARRHPLLLNGLALAGANLGPTRDTLGLPTDDGGLLTGNVIAGLPLRQLELIVLSGCETGAGTMTGDGTVGLQRAFHLAGARNVVASLWRVDDRATSALMRLFYYYQFQEQLPPVEALRAAQLALLRSPQHWQSLAELRGPNFQKAAQQLAKDAPAANAPLSPRLWASFVLSGPGM